MSEAVTHRILGALRLVDAVTGRDLTLPARVTVADVRVQRNRSGDFVLRATTRFPGYDTSFAQPPVVVPQVFTARIDTTTGPYLPRTLQITLPRSPDPAQAGEPESLFQPIRAPLLPAPAGTPGAGWAVIRVAVTDAAADPRRRRPLPGVLIQVLDAADPARLLGEGMTDWRGRVTGEALVGVSGIPAVIAAGGNGQGGGQGGGNNPAPVAVTTLAVQLRAIVDPAFAPDQGELPDPDDLRNRAGQLPSTLQPAQIGAGRQTTVSLAVAL